MEEHMRGGYYYHHHQPQQDESWNSSSSPSQGMNSSNPKSSGRSYDYFTALEEHINLQAQKLTLDWLKKHKGNNNNGNNNNLLDSEKIFIVYKFIQTPIEALIAGM